MNKFIYTVYDEKALQFNTPFFSESHDAATRAVHHASENDPLVSKYPADFSVFKLGTYDTDTGVMSTFESPKYCYSVLTLFANYEGEGREAVQDQENR